MSIIKNTLNILPVPTNITFGCGSIGKAGPIISKYGETALIVCGKYSAKKFGYLNQLVNLLEVESIKAIVYDQISPEPKSNEVNKGINIALIVRPNKQNISFVDMETAFRGVCEKIYS